jgi:hypothetical protein
MIKKQDDEFTPKIKRTAFIAKPKKIYYQLM